MLVQGVVRTLSAEFGAFLVVEIWSGPDLEMADAGDSGGQRPGFKVYAKGGPTLDALKASLARIRLRGVGADVEVEVGGKPAPPGMSPLLSRSEAHEANCHLVGIEVRPIYRNAGTGNLYPLDRQKLRRGLTKGLLRAFYQFTKAETTHKPPHYHSLGRTAVVKAVWDVDKRMAEVSAAFDLLMDVSPANPDGAWSEFERGRFSRAPVFLYRPREFDPASLKRALWEIPIERIEDPTLSELFQEKRSELDAHIGMLIDRGAPRFLFGSLQAFGKPGVRLVHLARSLLESIPPRAREKSAGKTINAQEFAQLARDEISYYKASAPELSARVFVRSDTTGLMVSRGNLLVGRSTRIPKSRIDALLQHELGTHMLTYFNGRAQRLSQLSVGLAGYEGLQEGLAVLAEYLVGGLSRPRLRLLAGRVAAVQSLVNGATFVEVFRELNQTWEFSQRTAFVVTMRVFRGGGLTKDMVYLKGLAHLLTHLGSDGDFEALFVGKIAADHIGIVRELQFRRILEAPLLRPRYMERPDALDRLERVRRGMAVTEMIEKER